MNTSRLVHMLVEDGDDARNLIAVVWAQSCVFAAMLAVGLIWALVRGWELTLAGFAIAPIFAITMAVQTKLVAECGEEKRARWEVAREYYEAIINVRGIHYMAFEPVFKSRFVASADKALTAGVRGALVEGCTYGLASGLIHLTEPLLFYVVAVPITQGRFSRTSTPTLTSQKEPFNPTPPASFNNVVSPREPPSRDDLPESTLFILDPREVKCDGSEV